MAVGAIKALAWQTAINCMLKLFLNEYLKKNITLEVRPPKKNITLKEYTTSVLGNIFYTSRYIFITQNSVN
jgi:hypothetical protein